MNILCNQSQDAVKITGLLDVERIQWHYPLCLKNFYGNDSELQFFEVALIENGSGLKTILLSNAVQGWSFLPTTS